MWYDFYNYVQCSTAGNFLIVNQLIKYGACEKLYTGFDINLTQYIFQEKLMGFL